MALIFDLKIEKKVNEANISLHNQILTCKVLRKNRIKMGRDVMDDRKRALVFGKFKFIYQVIMLISQILLTI